MTRPSADELAEALGLEETAQEQACYTPQEARVRAGFEEILAWVERNGRPPALGNEGDVFERIYATRLKAVLAQPRFHALLADLDRPGLLAGKADASASETGERLDEAALAEALGLDEESAITRLEHVKPRTRHRPAEGIADRVPCADFERFRPLFDQVQGDLDSGHRKTRRFGKDASIAEGDFFILAGHMVHVAELGEPFTARYGRSDSRLRVIYDNGMESDILLRSLQRALYKDETGRRITAPDAGPLFADTIDDGDTQSGTIYVLRSRSDHPEIAARRDLIHKIGVTGGDVESRIANARHQPTYLLADVEVVATYRLANINRTGLENLLHRFFAGARLEIELDDRFGLPVRPREWFLVPLPVIDDVVTRIQDGTITDYVYDPRTASLKRLGARA